MHDVKQLEIVMRYHEETKHHFNRYARALGYMDWANQPNPFRRYGGATPGRLPILSPDEEPLSPPYADLYRSGAVSSAPVTIRTLSRLFEYALALSAWKQVGDTRWALRSNPSSGNLHPTEGYLLIGGLPDPGLPTGLYHYAPKEHALERRAEIPDELFAALMKDFPPRAFLMGLSSVHWRSEEHTSELQSPCNLVCRLLLEKKKDNRPPARTMRAHESVSALNFAIVRD